MGLFNRKPEPKKFKIPRSDILQLAPGYGGCYATDKITVNGEPVGWMYRENDSMSGWSFMSGTESQEYMDDPSNSAIYDVNTIANYDPAIIPFLDSPRGSAFERKSPVAAFTPIADWVGPAD
jgi:hypothetical protein